MMPYATAGEKLYDSGESLRLLDKALDAADWKGFRKRRAEREAVACCGGRHGQYLEVTAPPVNEMGGIRFEKDGR